MLCADRLGAAPLAGAGFADVAVTPVELTLRYPDLGEFVLPYEHVRRAADPDAHTDVIQRRLDGYRQLFDLEPREVANVSTPPQRGIA